MLVSLRLFGAFVENVSGSGANTLRFAVTNGDRPMASVQLNSVYGDCGEGPKENNVLCRR